jgi:hypothetical protein
MANFAAVRAPPPRLLLAISQPKIKLQNRRSNPTGRQDLTHIAVAHRRLIPLFASAQASLLLASVFFYRTTIITEIDDDGMITLLHNHPDSGCLFPRRPDDEGRNGGATMKAATARQGRQRRRNDKGRNGGATTKGASAR